MTASAVFAKTFKPNLPHRFSPSPERASRRGHNFVQSPQRHFDSSKRIPLHSRQLQKSAALIGPDNVGRQDSGLVAGAGIDPVNMKSAIDQILNVNSQLLKPQFETAESLARTGP
jgi:hypothetical protein